jgi:hypothetical protein
MPRLTGALVFVLALPAIASAQPNVIVQVPYADIRVGPGGVLVNTPWIGVRLPRAVPVRTMTAPVPATGTPSSPAVPPPPAPAPDNQAPVVSRFVPAQPVPDSPTTPTVPVRDPLPLLPNTVPESRRPDAPLRASTFETFVATFKPAPGTYEAILIHTHTNQPVKVTFTLPEGTPRRVLVNRHAIEWDYGQRYVKVGFFPNGETRVVQK